MQNDLELSTTSVLSLFQTTKAEREIFVHDIMHRLVNEDADPLKVHLHIRAMEDIINSLTNRDEKKNKNFQSAKTYHKLLLDAAEKHGKKFQYQNAEFTIKEVGSSYDFSKCEDPLIIELLAQQEELKKKIDAQKELLKALPLSGMTVTDEETGETYKIYPPSKSSTTSVAVSLK